MAAEARNVRGCRLVLVDFGDVNDAFARHQNRQTSPLRRARGPRATIVNCHYTDGRDRPFGPKEDSSDA
jgi:hypothetical protein